MEVYDIKTKFDNEVENINNYINHINTLLFCYIKNYPTIYRKISSLSKSVNVNISYNFNDVKNMLKKLITYYEDEIKKINAYELDETVRSDDPTLEGDVLLFINTEIQKGTIDREKLFYITNLLLVSLSKSSNGSLPYDINDYNKLIDDKEKLYKIIDIALNNQRFYRQVELQTELDSVNQLLGFIELYNPDNLLNIYRQCFIQLMSIFDNCIFELFETSMKENFFMWIKFFDKDYSIKGKELSNYDSFELFRDSQIRRLLKNCYIKDLLAILYNAFPKIFDVNGEDIYSIIQEMIGRRNIHLHNNGITDNEYCNKYNIYKKEMGEYLSISLDYLEKLQKYSQRIVHEFSDKCK